MYLERISLTHFKSYESATFRFSSQVNCLTGPNGSGKTNLLDAIYYLSLTKSAFTNQDAASIQHESEFMMVDGVFVKEVVRSEEREVRSEELEGSRVHDKSPHYAFLAPDSLKHEQITVSLQRGQRKAVLHDKKPYERLSEHIGRFPVVLSAPNDTDLVREGSEERRKFFDGVLSQLNPDYLTALLHYNQLLLQRNSLLRQFAERNYLDDDLLEVYSEPLVERALQLHAERQAFIERFVPVFQRHYANLSESRESVEILYESEVGSDEFVRDFRMSRQRDVSAQRTTRGAHRDDYVFEIDQFPLRKFGSQGQQKSFVVELKLAQFELLTIEKAARPILLLDDIFDKLDDRRIQKLIDMMANGTFGQVFLTDARPERTEELLKDLPVDVAYLRIGYPSEAGGPKTRWGGGGFFFGGVL
ncbi:MAG: DNA replication and repair protein RecF [Cytophagaceae bacterium]|nr:DNA replication and repair protein RecF [Cytophagaceae bacterium]